MLLTRNKDQTRGFLGHRNQTPYSYENRARLILFGAGVVFFLISGSLISLFIEFRALKEERSVWSNISVQSTKEENLQEPSMIEELPTLIDQCVNILQREKVSVYRFNLERFGDERASLSPYFNFALVRFSLRGSWEGIQKGLTEVEALINHGVRVQEAKLNPGGGEILLKIYFQEPDNPPSP